MPRRRKQTRKSPRHIFRFKVLEPDGKTKILKAYAKVIPARISVALTLTADDVRKSIKLKGVGNTALCTMALCAKRHEAIFPHAVEGHIDWQYSRAYVVSKVSKKTGLPVECVVYHHSDGIARLNDTKGGQAKLLAWLEAEGDQTINLRAARKHPVSPAGRPEGHRTGARSGRIAGVGAKLRFAVGQAGGYEAPDTQP